MSVHLKDSRNRLSKKIFKKLRTIVIRINLKIECSLILLNLGENSLPRLHKAFNSNKM